MSINQCIYMDYGGGDWRPLDGRLG